jgi:hypothetical protein
MDIPSHYDHYSLTPNFNWLLTSILFGRTTNGRFCAGTLIRN